MQVALVGVSGYSGMVLYNLLKAHPAVEQVHLYGRQNAAPQPLSGVVPMFQKETAVIRPFDATAVMQTNDCIFSPHQPASLKAWRCP